MVAHIRLRSILPLIGLLTVTFHMSFFNPLTGNSTPVKIVYPRRISNGSEGISGAA